MRPPLAWLRATFMISSVMPAILMSICSEVTPTSVPATLKSMSPRWSSSPRMSERTAKRASSLISPMAMPAMARLSGTPASISASEVPHTVAIDDEPFELGDLRDHADGVGELLLRRQDRADCAPGELAVADLAAARRTDASGLTDRERREVVVQQERLLVGALQRVDELLVLAGAERGDHDRLGLAAGEQRGAVGARQERRLADDRTHGDEVAAVDALGGIEDVPAHDLGFEVLEHAGDLLHRPLGIVGAVREEVRHRLLLDLGDRVLALGLLAGSNRPCAGRPRRCRASPSRSPTYPGSRTRAAPSPPSPRGWMIASITGWKWRWPNITAPSMISSVSSAASDSTISTASCVPATTRSSLLSFISSMRRVEHVFALGEKPTRAPPIGPMNGRAGERERGRGRHHRDDVGIVLHVVREHGDDHLGVAAPAVGEQRTDRAVDQARGQRVLFGRTALALEVAAGNAAGGVVFLGVVDGERQEVDARLGLLRRHHRRDDGGFAVGRDDGAVGLAGYLAGLERELAPTPIELNSMNVKHCDGLSWFSRRGESHEQDGERLSRAATFRGRTASGDPAMASGPSWYRRTNNSLRRSVGSNPAAG